MFCCAVLGLAVAWGEAQERSRWIEPRGAGWAAVNESGKAIPIRPQSEGLPLPVGTRFRIDAEDEPAQPIRRAFFVLRKDGDQASLIQLRFRDDGKRWYRLLVVPGSWTSATVTYNEADGRSENVATSKDGPDLASPGEEYDVELRLEGARFEASVNGQRLLAFEDARLASGSMSLESDGARLLEARVEGTESAGARIMVDEQFAALRERIGLRAWPAALSVGAWFAALLVATLWLRSLCDLAPPLAVNFRAAALLLSPAALVATFLPAGPLPFLPFLLLAAALAGLLLGTFALRRHLRGGSDGTPLRPPRHALRAALVVAGAFVLLAAAAGEYGASEAAARVERARASLARLSHTATDSESGARLDASNAIALAGPYRSLDLETTLVLEPRSIAELRLRAHPRAALGVGLLLSTDPRVPSGFRLEGPKTFHRIGAADFVERGPDVPAGTVPAGVPLRLEVTARGDAFEARIDGAVVARAQCDEFPAGGVVLLVASGGGRVQGLTLHPAAEEPPIADRSFTRWRRGWTAAGVLAAAAFLCALLYRRPIARVVEPFAFGAIPVAASLIVARADGALDLAQLAWTALAATLVLQPSLLFHAPRTGRLRRARVLLASLIVLAAGPVATWCAAGPPRLESDSPDPDHDAFDGERLVPGLAHFQHPRLRARNFYLAQHRFRNRAFALAKPKGVVRVVCLGTSSTWGSGTTEESRQDYPSVLEDLLNAELKGAPRVEVINAGINGFSGPRLLIQLREVLVKFAPDVLTVSLFFNDTGQLSQLDEERFFERLMASEFENTLGQRFASRFEVSAGRRLFERFSALTEEPGADPVAERLAAWRSLHGDDVRTPPERFESTLRAMLDLARERGMHAVLMKEPLKRDGEWGFRTEFHAVMDRLGGEYGAPVVDPGPALRARGGETLFMDNVHPYPKGLRIVAEELLPAVRAQIERVHRDGRPRREG